MPDIKATLQDYIVGLRHIGHIVTDLKTSVDTFKEIYGITDECIKIIPPYSETAQNRIAFIKIAETEFELIEPISEEYKRLLFSQPSGGGGINHICYDVKDIAGAVACLAEKNIRPGYITPDGIIKLNSHKMVYLNPADTFGHLIELMEKITE